VQNGQLQGGSEALAWWKPPLPHLWHSSTIFCYSIPIGLLHLILNACKAPFKFPILGSIMPFIRHRPYAFSYFSWGIPYYSQSIVLEKLGFPPFENQYFATFQIPKEPCWQHGIWNVELLSLGGFPPLKLFSKTRPGYNEGISQDFSLLHEANRP